MLKYSDRSPSIYKVQWIHVCSLWSSKGTVTKCYLPRPIPNEVRHPGDSTWAKSVQATYGKMMRGCTGSSWRFQLLESCNLSQYLGAIAIWVLNFLLQCWNIELYTHVHKFKFIYIYTIYIYICLVTPPPAIARTFEFSFTGDHARIIRSVRDLLLQSQNQPHK